MNEELDFHKISKILRRRIGMIFCLTFLSAVIAGGISHFTVTPVYEETAQILISQERSKTDPLSSVSIQNDLQLINTYTAIIKSPLVLEQVIEKLELNLSAAELSEQINVRSDPGSQVIELSIRNSQSVLAVEIINATANLFQEEIRELMKMDNVVPLSLAAAENNPVPLPSLLALDIVIGALLGFMLAIGITFLMGYLDTAIKDEEDIEIYLNLPILGYVAPAPEKKSLLENNQFGKGYKITKKENRRKGILFPIRQK